MIADWLAWLLERGHLVNGNEAIAAATESWKRTVPLEEGFEGESYSCARRSPIRARDESNSCTPVATAQGGA